MPRFKEVFILVAGAAPQIITEFIFALSQKKPPILPDEIYIITTSQGKRAIQETLIKKNILNSLAAEYDLFPFSLGEDNFIVPRDEKGKEIEDIITKEDNEAIGDLITSFIREKTKENNSRLHCSLTGGRKTMSFYLGAALQLFGRPWDKLYHLLVSPEFESNPDFFYKPKKPRLIAVHDAKGGIRQLSTKEAQIHLAELPYIRLGQKLKLQSVSFKDLVAEGQQEIDRASVQPELRVNLRERTVTIGDKIIYFQPMLLFIYVAMLNQKIKGCRHPERPYCYECRDCFEELPIIFSPENLQSLLPFYGALYGETPYKTQEFLRRWQRGLPSENVRQYFSKIKKQLRRELTDDFLVSLYAVFPIKIYAASRYGVRSEKSKIFIE